MLEITVTDNNQNKTIKNKNKKCSDIITGMYGYNSQDLLLAAVLNSVGQKLIHFCSENDIRTKAFGKIRASEIYKNDDTTSYTKLFVGIEVVIIKKESICSVRSLLLDIKKIKHELLLNVDIQLLFKKDISITKKKTKGD